MSIRTKQEMYQKLHCGAFGNHQRLWTSYEDMLKDEYTGKVSLRTSYTAGGYFVNAVPFSDVLDVVNSWAVDGIDPKSIVYTETPSDDKLIIQGEFQRNPEWYLYYATVKKSMRCALEQHGQHATGFKAYSLLKSNMCPSSWEDFNTLIDLYPDDVIEFSTYSVNLGCIPHRNTIIWEVRSY